MTFGAEKEEVAERVAPYLDAPILESLGRLVTPGSSQHLPAQPHLTMTWICMLALGRKPARRDDAPSSGK